MIPVSQFVSNSSAFTAVLILQNGFFCNQFDRGYSISTFEQNFEKSQTLLRSLRMDKTNSDWLKMICYQLCIKRLFDEQLVTATTLFEAVKAVKIVESF
jgi:hypothetical protein